jgi:hypothetical protein
MKRIFELCNPDGTSMESPVTYTFDTETEVMTFYWEHMSDKLSNVSTVTLKEILSACAGGCAKELRK